MTQTPFNIQKRIFILQSIVAGLSIVLLLQLGSLFFRTPTSLSGDAQYGATLMYGPAKMPKSTSKQKSTVKKAKRKAAVKRIPAKITRPSRRSLQN